MAARARAGATSCRAVRLGCRAAGRWLQQIGDRHDAALDRFLSHVAEADDKLAAARLALDPVVGEIVQADRSCARGGDPNGQAGHCVEAGGVPGELDGGSVASEGGDQHGVPVGIDRAHRAQVAIVAATARKPPILSRPPRASPGRGVDSSLLHARVQRRGLSTA